MKNLFELCEIHDEQTKMRTISLLLDGEVLRWWRAQSAFDNTDTFDQFRIAVILRYGPGWDLME